MAKIKEILLSQAEIKQRVTELAQRIQQDFIGEELLMIGVLRGSFIFLADLIREIKECSVTIDFITVSSYENKTESLQPICLKQDINPNIKGENIIIVEDIIDSGKTIAFLKKHLLEYNPKSLKICSLLSKPSRRQVEIDGDYIGFIVPDEFVVGYGLDYANQFRNLENICIVDVEDFKEE